MAATTIRALAGFSLQAPPTDGILRIRSITIPPGSTPFASTDSYFEFDFDPVLDLSSPASALSFFSDKLAGVDSGLGAELVRRIATFAFDQVRRRDWISGLLLCVVLETEMDHRNDEESENENGMSENTEELSSDEEGDECCSICLEGFMGRNKMGIPLLPCWHRFHNGCIIKWLRNNTTCPICRCTCTIHPKFHKM